LCKKFNIFTPVVIDIEKDTIDNIYYRKVIYTGHFQLVLMNLKPRVEIGMEKHNIDQFFRVDEGQGIVVIDGVKTIIKDGSGMIVPAGCSHNVIAGPRGLKLYTIYSSPEHMANKIEM
jgi:mannose-6-phosphate isomerase-like protein (cupin superfamily)